ncbi:MAG: family 43 glycosylhydrolase [Acidimicrobiales bacterium]
MGGSKVRVLLVGVVLVFVSVVLVDASAAAPPDEGAGPAEGQRATRADVPPLPPTKPLPDPPPGLDLRSPVLGPGGLFLPADAADPDLLVVGAGTYYLFSTNTEAANVPVWRSTDLVTWAFLGDALPELPSWARSGSGTTWAPSVHRVGSTYNLYFSGMHVDRGRFCIGVATSADPAGPFRPGRRPLVCQTHRGGSIDPFLFTDATGVRALVYKTDGNCCGHTTKLWSQRLSGDGRRVVGKASELLFAGAEWEEGVIEGPTMVQRGGRYHLFYSGNWWNTHYYGIGHAVCEGLAGPCHRSSSTPFMANRSDGVGFGGPSVWESPSGEVWMTYHGWYGPGVGYENGGVRAAFGHRLDFPDWRPPPTCQGLAPTVLGTPGADVLTGTPGPDVIVGRGGHDEINGGGGDDVICGGGGADVIAGGRGNDRIRGDGGADRVTAGGGKDVVEGGPGADHLRGGPGKDQIRGGGHTDECWGELLRCELKHPTTPRPQ